MLRLACRLIGTGGVAAALALGGGVWSAPGQDIGMQTGPEPPPKPPIWPGSEREPGPGKAKGSETEAAAAPPVPADAPPPARRPGPAEVLIEIGQRIEISGTYPDALDRNEIASIFPESYIARDIVATPHARGDGWERTLEALRVVLPRIERARILLVSGRLEIGGRLKPGFALAEAAAALRAAVAPGWELAISLEETPPSAALSFSLAEGKVVVDGMVPFGLSVRQAMATMGETAAGQLATGGMGNTEIWSVALGAAGRLAALFEAATGQIETGRFAVEGRLAPGQSISEIAGWLAVVLPSDWEIEVAGRERPAADGRRRIGPATGKPERRVAGRWLPVMAPIADARTCDRAAAAAQRDRRIEFASGRSVVAERSERVLDRIAGLAFACLRVPGRLLVIGGHSDAKGEEAENLDLSQDRADAVRAALSARGIPREATFAIGYGAARPIAPNDTEDGRRRNRRITFIFADP